MVDRQQTVVGTALTSGHICGISQFADLIDRQHGCLKAFFIFIHGDKGSTESTHDTGDIRSDGGSAGDHLEAL